MIKDFVLKFSHRGELYTAKWWTQGETPSGTFSDRTIFAPHFLLFF